MTNVDDKLDVLAASVARLAELVRPLSDEQITTQSYADKWSIADVLSHLGSGAVIGTRRLDDGLAGTTMPDGFAPSVWDTWNAKSPRAKTDDGLASDAALISRLQAVTDGDRGKVRFSLGPFEFDFSGLVGLRLNEHALHSWDIAVALDPTAKVAADAIPFVVDNLALTARFTAKPTGSERTILVRTTDPARTFVITLTPDAAALDAGDSDGAADLTMPAESFVRLVYGRLDAAHTPTIDDPTGVLDELRRVFPGP